MAAEAVRSSSGTTTIVPPNHEVIRKIEHVKFASDQCGDRGKISLFFQTEEQLRKFQPRNIEGLKDLSPTCIGKTQQNQELEMFFLRPNAHGKLDAAMQLIAKHFGIALDQ